MFVWFIIFNLDDIDTSSFSHTVVTQIQSGIYGNLIDER